MKRVLVTGASGFVGRWSLPFLASRGYEVHALSSRAPEPAGAEARWHCADLTNEADMLAVVSSVRPTHLLHLAWHMEHRLVWTSPLNVRWVQASLNLVHAFQRHGGARVVTGGTCAEYGRCDGCNELTSSLAPETLYGACKHALQLATTAFAGQTGLSSAWGRIFFLFGPHEHPDRLVPSVIRALLRGEPARCTHGGQIRDFLDVEDAAHALVTLLDSDLTGPVNIASGVGRPVRDVVHEIGHQLGRPELIQLGAIDAAPGEPPILAPATTRLAAELGWRPRYTLESGLARAIEWWRAAL